MTKQIHEIRARQFTQIEPHDRLGSFRFDFVNSTIAAIPGIERIDVRRAFVAPVGDEN
jgi:hypothetical protein